MKNNNNQLNKNWSGIYQNAHFFVPATAPCGMFLFSRGYFSTQFRS